MPCSMMSEGLKFQKYTNFPQTSTAVQVIDIFCCVVATIRDSRERQCNYHFCIFSGKTQHLCSRNLPSCFSQKLRFRVIREMVFQEMRDPK